MSFSCTGSRNLIIRKMRQSITQANVFFGVLFASFTLGMLTKYVKYECNAKLKIHGLLYTSMRCAAKNEIFMHRLVDFETENLSYTHFCSNCGLSIRVC